MDATKRVWPTRCFAGILLLALVLPACGGSDDEGAAGTPTTVETTEPSPTGAPTVAPTVTPGPTPTEPPPSPTVTPAPTPTPGLPGEPFDLYVPVDGEVIGVVGVRYDDTLEVHALPGELSPLVGRLPNLADTVEGTGDGRLLPASIWWRIRYEEIEGWAGSAFLARIGGTFDSTAELVADNGGEYPVAETMLQLGMQVADLVKSEDPPSRVVVSVAPSVGDLGEITIDVVGIGDDAVIGYRLHVFGDPSDMGGEGFRLSSVESTLLCGRGVSDGSCV